MALNSSRRVGLNEHTSLYGTDFMTLSDWEVWSRRNLVAEQVSETLLIPAGNFNDFVTISGATTNEDYRRIIRPALGAFPDGIPKFDGTTAAFTTTTVGETIERTFFSFEAYFQVQDITAKVIRNADNPSETFAMLGLLSVAVGCISAYSRNAKAGKLAGGYTIINGGGAVNCICISDDNISFAGDSGTGFVYNCDSRAVHRGTFGFKDIIVKNGLSSGDSIAYDNCVLTTSGSDGATGSVGLINQTYSFVDADNDDYHLASGSDGIGQATDLSADAVYAFNDDVDFEERT